MKKITFFVEGQTEQLFINKLLIEIAGQKNISVELEQFQGYGRRPTKNIYPKTASNPVSPKHYALIHDCRSDSSVRSRIIDNYQTLFSQGHTQIIGLLDFYPQNLCPETNLTQFENELINGTVKRNRQVTPPLPANTAIVVAVNEIESWFLSECNHFTCVDAILTNSFIVSRVGFDTCIDDMTLRSHPAQDLHDIYQLVGKAYKNKKKDTVERTIECLDYANIYIKIASKITKLNDLVSIINTFLT